MECFLDKIQLAFWLCVSHVCVNDRNGFDSRKLMSHDNENQ